MKPNRIKLFFALLILAPAGCLMTGVDQYIHILVCHHESHHPAESHQEHPGHSDEQHCPVCQFFVSCQHQSILTNGSNLTTDLVPAISTLQRGSMVIFTTPSLCKISRAPPAA